MAKKNVVLKVKEKVETKGACKDAVKESHKPILSLARRVYLRKKRRKTHIANYKKNGG